MWYLKQCCFLALWNLANFDIVPSNVTQAEGLNAVFLCRHSTSRFYDWGIDGRSESLNTLPNVTAGAKDADDGGIPIRTLTIVATEQYNVSVIVCVVPSASSTEAILTVQGMQWSYIFIIIFPSIYADFSCEVFTKIMDRL